MPNALPDSLYGNLRGKPDERPVGHTMALALLKIFPSLLIYLSAWGPARRLRHEESI